MLFGVGFYFGSWVIHSGTQTLLTPGSVLTEPGIKPGSASARQLPLPRVLTLWPVWLNIYIGAFPWTQENSLSLPGHPAGPVSQYENFSVRFIHLAETDMRE